jgi:hypothetical protein
VLSEHRRRRDGNQAYRWAGRDITTFTIDHSSLIGHIVR